jgi:hypothetical protein
VTNYSQNNQEHLDSIKLKFGQRLQDSLDCFQKNLEYVKEKLEEKKHEDEQKTIEKFEKWVLSILINFYLHNKNSTFS